MQICNSLQVTSTNSIPIKCIKCNTIITNNDIFEIIIPNTPEYNFIMDKLITIFMLRNSAKNNSNSQKKYFWCPNKKENCNYIYYNQIKEIGETTMTCPNCSCRICLLCNDILDPDIPHNPDCQNKLYSQLDDKDKKWIMKNSKDCPMCHTVYEKNRGCNHMTCTICHPPTHFCYICGNILNDFNPLSHFSDKESKCCNKLWDEEKKNEIDEEENIAGQNLVNEYQDEDEDENEEKEDSKIMEDNYEKKRKYSNNNSRRNNNSSNIDLTQVMFERINNNNIYNDNFNNSFNFEKKKHNLIKKGYNKK